LFAVGAYQAERLRPEQAPALQNLFNRCPDYFHLVEGHPAPPDAAEKEFSDRPANTAAEDCFVFGLRLPDSPLTGVLQAFRHYPEQNHWYIGLLLLDPAARCTGLGAACYQSFELWAATKGATKILIAVLTDNLRAHPFWQRQNFILPRCYRPMTFGARTHIPIEYEKPLPPGPATPSADAGGHYGKTAR
jgi:GNAT superfamily N-acetyltransferase